MKKTFLIIAVSICTLSTMAQQKEDKKEKKEKKEATRDTIDNRMKGPDGEPIVIGKGGGRYYWKNGNKVYVEYKGKKKKG